MISLCARAELKQQQTASQFSQSIYKLLLLESVIHSLAGDFSIAIWWFIETLIEINDENRIYIFQMDLLIE